MGAACALALCVSKNAGAENFELRVITGEPSAATQQTLEALASRYPSLMSGASPRALARPGAAVYIALGPAALRAALEASIEGPLLALYVSNEAFREILSSVRADRRRFAVTAIYAEPSPVFQMRLIRAIYKRQISVGVLLTEKTAHIELPLRQAARMNDIELVVERVELNENPLRALAQSPAIGVWLAIPDRSLYTPESLRNILESTYRRGQAIIGFSAALVRAGTLASVYSTIEDNLMQAKDVIEQLGAGRAVLPQYPTSWRIIVNDNVARSLNIPIEEDVRSMGNSSR
jgi:putative tryptophan/tyrosine transport system substrate-binding protein